MNRDSAMRSLSVNAILIVLLAMSNALADGVPSSNGDSWWSPPPSVDPFRGRTIPQLDVVVMTEAGQQESVPKLEEGSFFEIDYETAERLMKPRQAPLERRGRYFVTRAISISDSGIYGVYHHGNEIIAFQGIMGRGRPARKSALIVRLDFVPSKVWVTAAGAM